jgi:hypothetical protein
VSVFKLGGSQVSARVAPRITRVRPAAAPAPRRAAAPAPRVAPDRKPALGTPARQIPAPAPAALGKPSAKADAGDDDWTTF